MIRQLRDDGEEQKCDCGLPVDKSSLPRGWSVHLSQDQETFGEVRLYTLIVDCQRITVIDQAEAISRQRQPIQC